MNQLAEKVEALKPELIEVRQQLHRHPELGFQEYQTAARVAGYLEKLGLEVQTGVGGTGVIALLRGAQNGPTVGLRACLDTLPIQEPPGLDYTSECPGVMHACGHDGNMTMVLGAARVLAEHKDQLKGNVKFIFQPSEEETGGAAKMIQEGCLNNPSVDIIVTPHNWHGYKQGQVIATPGTVLASSDIFKLEILGKPGHGAWPDQAVDPIPVAAEVVTALQKIVSREISPLKSGVLSLGKIYGGTAVNVIPDCVTIEGTVRTFDAGVRDFMQRRIEEIADGVTRAARATYKLTYQRIMPPAYNDPQLTAQATELMAAALGADNVVDAFIPDMGCEEFSLFQEQIPGLFLFIGKDRVGEDIVPIHAPNYIFNDEILTVGVKALCAIAMGYRKY